MVLPSGELHIREVGPEDGYKSYQCRTKHRLTGETRLSATKGRLVITGNLVVTNHRTRCVFIRFKGFWTVVGCGWVKLVLPYRWAGLGT